MLHTPIEVSESISGRPKSEKQLIRHGACWVEYLTRTQIEQKLRVSVTDSCNFNCFYCHNEGQGPINAQNGFMSPTEIAKIVEVGVISGVRNVKLTGGEPLIYRHSGSDILDLVTRLSSLREDGLKFDLSLITNGYLLDKYAEGLKEAGLDRINISLPTLSPNIFQKYIKRQHANSIERVVEGISAAASAGLKPIKINMPLFYSPMKEEGNVTEIPQIIELCKTLGVDELRLYTLLWHKDFSDFDEYYQYWDSNIFSRMDFLSCGISNEQKSKVFTSLRSFAKDMASVVYPKVRFVIDCDGIHIAFENMKVGRFQNGAPCDSCENPYVCQEGPYALRVSAHGEIRGCLLSNNSVNFIEAYRDGLADADLINLFKSSYSLLPKDEQGKEYGIKQGRR